MHHAFHHPRDVLRTSTNGARQSLTVNGLIWASTGNSPAPFLASCRILLSRGSDATQSEGEAGRSSSQPRCRNSGLLLVSKTGPILARASGLRNLEASVFGETSSARYAPIYFRLDPAYQGNEAPTLVHQVIKDGQPYSVESAAPSRHARCPDGTAQPGPDR
jgi:hypothetical protein